MKQLPAWHMQKRAVVIPSAIPRGTPTPSLGVEAWGLVAGQVGAARLRRSSLSGRGKAAERETLAD